jgi:hypothetical protein
MAIKDLITGSYVDDAGMFGTAYNWEPKKQHQFVLSIDSGTVSIPSYLIKASGKPQLTQGEVTLDHINVQRYVKGKSNWNALTISLYDAIEPSGAQAVMDWIMQHHESHTGRDGYSTDYKKEILLQQLDPRGAIIEQWKLSGCWITDSNWGDLDWSTEDVVMIDLGIRYDWAELTF